MRDRHRRRLVEIGLKAASPNVGLVSEERSRIIASGQSKSRVEQIATRMKSDPARVLKVAKRLGIYFPPNAPKEDGRLKAKGK